MNKNSDQIIKLAQKVLNIESEEILKAGKNISNNLIMVDIPSSSARKIKLNVNQDIDLYFSKEDLRVYPV